MHFGTRIVESEKKLVADNEGCVKHMSHEHEIEEGRHATIWCRLLSDVLEHEFKKLDDAALNDVEVIEICLGGDHGKGAYVFMEICIIRRKNIAKEPHRIEIKLGEIEEPKDSLDYIKELLKTHKQVLTI